MAKTKLPDDLTPDDELADVFDVSTATIRSWRRDGAPAHRVKGKAMCSKSELAEWRRRTGKTGTSRGTTLDDARIRKENALADKYELDLAERRGELVDRSVFETTIARLAARHRNANMSLVARVATQFPGDQGARVQHVLDRETRAMLQQLADDCDSEEATPSDE